MAGTVCFRRCNRPNAIAGTHTACRRGWALVCGAALREQTLPLPDTFDPYEFQQFRFRKQSGKLSIQWEAHLIGVLDVASEPASVGLCLRHADADFDSVRVTEIV